MLERFFGSSNCATPIPGSWTGTGRGKMLVYIPLCTGLTS